MFNLFRKPAAKSQPQIFSGALWSIQPRFIQIMGDAQGTQPKQQPDKPYKVTGAGVAIVCLDGPMIKNPDWFDLFLGCCCTADVADAIDQASADPEATSIVIKICSPGGMVAGTAELADAVNGAKAQKPVIAFVEDACCSAAYWVASQADKIISNAVGFTGSIGTYAVLQDTTGLQQQLGLKFTVVSTGEYKGLGADGKVSDLLIADVQREVNSINELFLAAVQSGRGFTAEQTSERATGQVWIASEALKLGLIDSIGTFGDAIGMASGMAPPQGPIPISKAKLYEQATAIFNKRYATRYQPESQWVATHLREAAAKKEIPRIVRELQNAGR